MQPQEDLDDYVESLEDQISTRLRLFKESMFELWGTSNREMKHLVLATLIQSLKTDKGVTYKDLSDMYGVLSPDTFKSLLFRRTYLNDVNANALYEWIIEEIALHHASTCFSSLAKSLYPRQLSITFTREG